ncbi:MAG: hypothetical protein IPM92_10300 [Saprospiraceae bacterium]|nr:hypothetical protein [Saprospiraceae bacterium]
MKMHNLNWKNAMIAMVFVISLGMVSAKTTEQLPEVLDATELRFSEFKCNVKDFHRNILYTAQGEYLKYFFYHQGISIRLTENNPTESASILKTSVASAKSQVLNLNWENANSNMEITGVEEFKYRKAAKANKECEEKQFRKLYYNQLFPGIDLLYSDRADQLEMDFQVASGFNYQDIQFNLEGANDLKIDPSGRLIANTNSGDIMIEKPLVHQEGRPVVASWVITKNTVGLKIAQCNENKVLHIRTHIIQKRLEI